MASPHYPPPPIINAFRGADDYDIDRSCEHVGLLNKLIKGAVRASVAHYEKAVLAAIENHNENIYGRRARPDGFVCGLKDVIEDFERQMDDLAHDVIIDLRQAKED